MQSVAIRIASFNSLLFGEGNGKIAVEIELPEVEVAKLEEFIEARCLDQEKWLKKIFASGLEYAIKSRERK
jgi:hypothetical protein